MQVLYETPVRPRQLDAGIPADLETICLKCLRSDPAQRYASATEVAEDLERWLAGRPILARPVGRFERAWKWVRRNRVTSALIALVILLMVVGTTASSIFAVMAHHSEQRAIEAADLAQERAESEAMARRHADGAYHHAEKMRRQADRAWRGGEKRYNRVLGDWQQARQDLLQTQRLLLGEPDRLTRNQLDRQWRKDADAGETFPALYHLDRLIAEDADRRSYLFARRVKVLHDAQRKDKHDSLIALALAQQAFLTPELIGDSSALLPLMGQAAKELNTSAGYRWLGALQLERGAIEHATASLETALQLRRLDAAPREECLLALAEARQGKPEKARKQDLLARQWLDRFAEHARKQGEGGLSA